MKRKEIKKEKNFYENSDDPKSRSDDDEDNDGGLGLEECRNRQRRDYK